MPLKICNLMCEDVERFHTPRAGGRTRFIIFIFCSKKTKLPKTEVIVDGVAVAVSENKPLSEGPTETECRSVPLT